MHTINNRFRLTEIIFCYILCAAGCFLLGFMLFDYLSAEHILDLNTAADTAEKVRAVGSTMLFKNNILFFALTSVLPVLNILLVVVQFFQLGTTAYSIRGLSAGTQFVLLYRHTAFEIIALVLSVYISYRLLFMGLAYTQNQTVSKGFYKRSLKSVGIAYLFMTAATVIGALLEGNVHAYS